MDKLLDFSVPTDVGLLDRVVETLYNGSPEEKRAVQSVLTAFQENPDAWLRADSILEQSTSINCKFFALQVLEACIKTRWKILPREQRDGIKTYIVSLIMKLAAEEQREKIFLGKLNLTLVQILKQEWPHDWGTFIPEIVELSKTNENLCENNMHILKLLSEEVFDFSLGQLTQAKAKELKDSFQSEFSLVFSLCEAILNCSGKPSLLTATLKTLRVFLNWIPVQYIFETPLIGTLTDKFFPTMLFRNDTLSCLTEIASLTAPQYDAVFSAMYVQFMAKLLTFVPADTDMNGAYQRGSTEDKEFVQQLALFFASFFTSHLALLEADHQPELLQGLAFLVRLSEVQSDGRDIFKIALEYWCQLSESVFQSEIQTSLSLVPKPAALAQPTSPRLQFYAPVFSRVRSVLISNMAKPEEVLVVEDENGEIVREQMKDNDAITLYKTIKETLVFLTHLDCDDTEAIMLEKLNLQVDGTEWSWNNLNSLCWAVGSISGAFCEDSEKRFLVMVIKELLGLCEMKRGKDNKAVIASNIMYVVGQYPRFLRAHWKFLKTVVNKLFEFMHEPHPGVQDMACDTFLKIAQKCRRKFVTLQYGETNAFIEELLENLPITICDLELHQIYMFHEAVGYMIQSLSSREDAPLREALIGKLFARTNHEWFEIIGRARVLESSGNTQSLVDYLQDASVMKTLAKILTINVRVAFALGHPYIFQLTHIYLDVLTIYKLYSQLISNTVATQGVAMTRSAAVRHMRAVKKETLKLIETVVEATEDAAMLSQQFVPRLLDPILGDYLSNIPETRDPGVLSLFASIVNALKANITSSVPRIFEAVFECTLSMITANFEDFPEHRICLFKLVRAINNHCFAALFVIHPNHFKLVMHSIVWAFKHAERNISDTGLHILYELLTNLQNTPADVKCAFYKDYFLSLVQDLFFVLTDTMHKPGFKLQASILLHLFHLVESNQLQQPVLDPTGAQPNPIFLRTHVAELLSSSFGHLSAAVIRSFVEGVFVLSGAGNVHGFKAHLRDFLVQLKEFSGDNSELFLEEQQAAEAVRQQSQADRLSSVPGLLPPNTTPDEMDD